MEVVLSVGSFGHSEEILGQVRVDYALDVSVFAAFPEMVEYSITAVGLVDEGNGVPTTEPGKIFGFVVVAEGYFSVQIYQDILAKWSSLGEKYKILEQL